MWGNTHSIHHSFRVPQRPRQLSVQKQALGSQSQYISSPKLRVDQDLDQRLLPGMERALARHVFVRTRSFLMTTMGTRMTP